jgi:MFS family permease
VSEKPDARDAPAPAAAPRPSLKRRVILLGGTLAAIVVVYFIAASTVPRWWAHRIGDQVNGSMTAGIGLGLFYGVVFTFIPLFILTFALRRGRSWRARAWLVGAAVVLALPNLMTLGIVLGGGSAAHAGERTLDVEAPDFRAASLVGAIIGALGVLGVRYLMLSRRRAKERESQLRGELRTRDEAAKAAAEAEKQP